MMCHQHHLQCGGRRSFVLVVIGILTLLASSTKNILVDAKCPEYLNDDSSEEDGCMSVKSFAEFEAAIKNAQSTLQPNITFCPFSIDKTEGDSPVLLYGEIGLRCRYHNLCYISGKGSHMIFYGARTQVTLQGFVFRQASTSALRIWGNTPLQQNICSCHFTSNKSGKGNGGAIRTEIKTNINIENSRFMANQADAHGGAIYNKGMLDLHNIIFGDNAATMGGAIASSYDDGAFVSMTDIHFENNIALSKGPALYIEAVSGDKSVKFSAKGIVAKGNLIKMSFVPILGMGDIVRGKCDGAYDDGFGRCVSFTSAFIASPVEINSLPDVSPTMMPVLPPSSMNETTRSTSPVTSHPTESTTTPTEARSSPTLHPTDVASDVPSSVPSTKTTTVSPSDGPTITTSSSPSSSVPSTKTPTVSPSDRPTITTSSSPSSSMSSTKTPTVSPSGGPTVTTSSSPPTALSFLPTLTPTADPTLAPTPSKTPTVSPSEGEIVTISTSSSSILTTSTPTAEPTSTPTPLPSNFPTDKPTGPTSTPTAPPSNSPTDKPTPRPTHKPVEILPDSVDPHKPPKGYFNYNPNSPFGPQKWNNINAVQTAEYKYWAEFADRINPPMENNYCDWEKGNNANKQSPLDVVDTGAECLEYHEIRTKPGDFLLNDPEVKLEIHPNKMRIVWPRRINNREEPDTPSADIPKGWGDFIDATHTDLIIPAEHTLDGKRYQGEWRTYHMHPGGKGTAVVTTLIDASPDNDKNPAFQKALKAWEERFDYNRYQCLFSRGRRAAEELDNDAIHDDNNMDAKSSSPLSFDAYRQQRRMQEGDSFAFEPLYDHGDITDPLTSKGRFDPYHERLVPSVWFYGYFGSLTEPPCYPIATWRIIDTPMKISEKQHIHMKRLLFEHMDENCVYTSNHYEESVARPIQKNVKRDIHRCTCKDFTSDAHRKATGEYVCGKFPVLPSNVPDDGQL